MKIKSLKYFMLLCKIWKKQWRISPLKKNAKTASRTRRGLLGPKKMHSIMPCFSVEREERRWRALLASLHALVASITCCNHHHCHSHHCRHHHCHHHTVVIINHPQATLPIALQLTFRHCIEPLQKIRTSIHYTR